MSSPPGMEWGVSQTEEKGWGIGDTGLEVVGEAGIAAAGLRAWIARRAEGMVRRGASGWGHALAVRASRRRVEKHGHRGVAGVGGLLSSRGDGGRGRADSFPSAGMAGGGWGKLRRVDQRPDGGPRRRRRRAEVADLKTWYWGKKGRGSGHESRWGAGPVDARFTEAGRQGENGGARGRE
jgi:hypothetical protein